MVKGVEPRFSFKQPFESQTSLFQEPYIGFAVFQQLLLEVKHNVIGTLFLMPLFQGLFAFRRHGFGHVVIEGRDDTHVVLVVAGIELVGEVPFFQFR